ncbi:MAG TPA: efflux RND transporter periplasmic adaptor subunit [Vicinamibacterales bacterium]|nr:efflux RND transporter periplasmic adaptor subunit [Vicinamibacterales bacterium]
MKIREFETSLGLTTIAAVLASGCVGRAGSDVDTRTAKAVRLVTVNASTGAESTTYSAIITPNAQVDLAFRVSGYVVDVCRTKGADGRLRAVEPGAAVTTGLVLARVRAIDYQAIVDRAEGLRDESSAGVDAAAAALVEAQAALTQAESDFGRIAALWEQESVTKPAYDASRARLDAAKAKVDAAAASLNATNQRTTQAAAQLQEARIALGDTELHAPFDAILLERHVDVGTLVSPGTPAFTIADLDRVKARFSVPDTALEMFHTGMPLPLTVDAFANESFQGRVLSVAPAADPKARSFEIAVSIENHTLKLRAGMIASTRIAGGPANRRQVRIPIDALVHDPIRDQYVVYTLEQKSSAITLAKAVQVRPGPLAGNQVSILEGLAGGERIVASGANLLQSGDVVKEVQ